MNVVTICERAGAFLLTLRSNQPVQIGRQSDPALLHSHLGSGEMFVLVGVSCPLLRWSIDYFSLYQQGETECQVIRQNV